MKDKEWFDMTEEEQEELYETENIGGGFREVGLGCVKQIKEEDLTKEMLETLKRIKEEST